MVEFGRRTVGLAVRCRGGFWFHASSKRFAPLEGRTFARLAELDRALRHAAQATSA